MTDHILSAVLNVFWGFIVIKAAWYIHVGLSNIGQGVGEGMIKAAKLLEKKP